jgi:hypothetical protein
LRSAPTDEISFILQSLTPDDADYLSTMATSDRDHREDIEALSADPTRQQALSDFVSRYSVSWSCHPGMIAAHVFFAMKTSKSLSGHSIQPKQADIGP